MYDQFGTIQYPLALLNSSSMSAVQIDGLKKHLVDFRLQVYSNSITTHVIGYLTGILTGADSVKMTFQFKTSFAGSSNFVDCAALTLLFNTTQPYAQQQNVRIYFDTSDFSGVDSAISKLEGYLCISDLYDMRRLFEQGGGLADIAGAALEPTTISVIGAHRVDAFRCQFAKPLILQTNEDMYGPVSEPVSGAVNFVAGANCVVTLQEFANTVILSAARNANGTDEERCGIWSEKIPGASKDVLCDEAVYSIGGAVPDDAGNVLIQGQYPLVVSSLTKEQLPADFQTLADGFNHINRYIFVGLPVTDSGVNCNIQEPPNPCN